MTFLRTAVNSVRKKRGETEFNESLTGFRAGLNAVNAGILQRTLFTVRPA